MTTATRPLKELDDTQYRWWHRLRKSPKWLFIGTGIVMVPLLIVMSHVMVTLLLGGGAEPARLCLMYLGLAPFTGGAFAWTWSYTERRYQASDGGRCGSCSYPLTGVESDRCPECGCSRNR